VFPNTTFNCNPDQIQVFNPDPDRRRPDALRVLGAALPGRGGRPEYDAYLGRPSRTGSSSRSWSGEDIAIYQQLARTKRSSGYRQNILSERECKIGKYHDTMDAMVLGAEGRLRPRAPTFRARM
jgi:hypothetical protein